MQIAFEVLGMWLWQTLHNNNEGSINMALRSVMFEALQTMHL